MIVNSCLGFGFFKFQGRKDSKRERNSFVDIYGTTLVLTAAERPDLRHRTEPKNPDDPEAVQKKKNQDEFKKSLAIFRSKWGR